MRHLVGLLAFTLLFIAAVSVSFKIATHIEHAEIAVVSKERLLKISSSSEGKQSSEWRNFVYTADETYVVEDSMWNWHFTSGTVYARIQEGKRCRVTLSGYRVGFLSMFQNIIAANCQPTTQIEGKLA